MSDEINQGREVGKSIVDNWPLLAIIFTPIAEIGRRVLKAVTRQDLREVYESMNRNRSESDMKIEKCHTELREDIHSVSKQVADLTQHLLRRREDRE